MNSQVGKKDESADISVRDLISPLFRRRRVLIVTFLTAFVLMAIAGLMTPSYKSRMEVLVSRERLDPVVTTESTSQMVTENTPVSDAEINSEAELLQSQDVIQQVVIANGLDKPKKNSLMELLTPQQTDADRLAKAVKRLAKQLKIAVVTKTNLIEVSYSSSDPQLSYGVLKSLGAFYVRKHVEVHRPPGSFDFFAQETKRYQDALHDSEEKLRDLSQRQGVAAPDVERTDLAAQVTASIGQLHAAQQGMASDEQRIQNDQAQMARTPQRSATQEATNVADRLLDDLNTALLAAQVKRTQLASKYDANYPLVKEADQEIAQAKASIAETEKTRYVNQTTDRDPTYELLREDEAKSRSDLAAQRAAVAAIERGIESMQSQMVDLNQKDLTQQDLTRDAKANEGNYLLYLSKREQERISDALDETRIANVAIAEPPAIPVLPVYSPSIVLLVSLFAALVLSVIAAYAVDYLDSSFNSPAQVTDILGIPVVIAMPRKTA